MLKDAEYQEKNFVFVSHVRSRNAFNRMIQSAIGYMGIKTRIFTSIHDVSI